MNSGLEINWDLLKKLHGFGKSKDYKFSSETRRQLLELLAREFFPNIPGNVLIPPTKDIGGSSMKSAASFHTFLSSISMEPIPETQPSSSYSIMEYLPDEEEEEKEEERRDFCGRVFKKGEPLYYCKTCALDSTCVLCAACFKATGHTTGEKAHHDFSVRMSPLGGGCCDCGDPEAWTIPLNCTLHGNDSIKGEQELIEQEDASESQQRHFLKTFNTIFEFILTSLRRSSSNLQLGSVEKIEADARLAFFEEKFWLSIPSPSSENTLTTEEEGDDEDKPTLYSCLLWNDDTHSFQDVIERVCDAITCTHAVAKQMAESVDRYVILLSFKRKLIKK